MKLAIVSIIFFLMTGCSSQYPNTSPTGKQFPAVTGTSLEQANVDIPNIAAGKPALFLIGYKQNSQFDIDRWFIGLDMKEVDIVAYELPTIAGMFPRMFSPFIDEGMRKGIPKELWGGVITIYKDGDKVQAFTGNQNPNNARAVLVDANGKVVYFHDRGFSVSALNQLIETLNKL